MPRLVLHADELALHVDVEPAAGGGATRAVQEFEAVLGSCLLAGGRGERSPGVVGCMAGGAWVPPAVVTPPQRTPSAAARRFSWAAVGRDSGRRSLSPTSVIKANVPWLNL